MATKLIVSNKSALTKKYGAQGQIAIHKAVLTLITADATHGITTSIVYLDDPSTPSHVTVASDQKQNKTAIDAVWAAKKPNLLMILGSLDVVPHQELTDPVVGDSDPLVPSDLPYACNAAYSKDIHKFLSPTRAVSRLPDVTGATDPKPFIALIDRPNPSALLSNYVKFLGATATVWQGSSDLSLSNIFGAGNTAHPCPPNGPNWPIADISTHAHFFNLHGSPGDPHFYGQLGGSYPIAHSAAYVQGKVKAGTITASEACYGAQLYDPVKLGVHMPMSNTYLYGGAYAYFGSTTIAYGPSVGNGQADLTCQYFLIHLRAGESIGVAGLKTRTQFIAANPALGPTDLKTIAQFLVLGDPSVFPVVTRHQPNIHVTTIPTIPWTEWIQDLSIVENASVVAGDRATFAIDRGQVAMGAVAVPRVEAMPDMQWTHVETRNYGFEGKVGGDAKLVASAPSNLVLDVWRGHAPFPMFLIREHRTVNGHDDVRVYVSR